MAGEKPMIEIDWGSHTTVEPLERFEHIFGYATLLAPWRKVRWTEAGSIIGIERRPGAKPERRRVTATTSVVAQELERLRPRVLREFSRCGQLKAAVEAVVTRTDTTMKPEHVYHHLIHKSGAHFDADWHNAYEGLKRSKPWKSLAAA